MLKQLLVYGFCIWITGAHAQGVTTVAHAKEVSFTTDNDAYLFQKKDAYYTNGFFFSFKTAYEKNGKKRVQGYELGQMIFTPFIRKTANPSDIDRPYCGYLFLHFNQTRFPGKNSVLQYNAGIGEVGNASFGESVQNSYHKLLGYGRFTGWQYQVQNSLGVDMGVSYAHTLFEDSSWIKFIPVTEANLGMNFTNAKLGAYLCLGSFEDNSNSALWNARVQTKSTVTRKKYELFAYWHPQLVLQGYNSTVQGGLFHKSSDTTAVLGNIEPWMFQQNWGMCYAEGRWTTNLELIYQAKEAVAQKTPQRYVSIRVSYRLH
jgi:lipid A 3-O-deacylase